MKTEERNQRHSTKEDYNFVLKNYHPVKEKKQKQQYSGKERFDGSLRNYRPNKGE